MNKLISLSLLGSLCTLHCLAGNDAHSTGARENALGSSSLLITDAFSAFNNQANLAFLKGFTGSIYVEQRYLLKELNYSAGAVAVPLKVGTFALDANYFGFSAYNEKRAGLAYGRLITENFSIGVQLDYFSTSIQDYGNGNSFSAEAGLTYHINPKWSAAAHVFNPFHVSSGYMDDHIPTEIALGTSYEPSKKLWLGAEIHKQIDNLASLHAGIEYRIIQALDLRGGLTTNPSTYSFGIGIHVGALDIDLASAYHQILGVTPMIGLSYDFVKAEGK